MSRPKVNSEGQKQLDAAHEKFEDFKEQLSSHQPIDARKPVETQEQTLLSKKQKEQMDAPYIKPMRSINSKEKFDEKYRKDWERDWEYVKCTVENYELIGSPVECWTKRYAGDPAHFWNIPVNKPIYIPRLLARQLTECKYNKLSMEEKTVTGHDGHGSYYGALVVEHTKHRINALPCSSSFDV